MNTLFTNEGVAEITRRINSLTPASQRQWGKMDVKQMLAHCQGPLNVGTGRQQLRHYNFLMRLIGRMVKQQLVKDEKPYKHNQPTDPGFKVEHPQGFEEERKKLIAALEQFSAAGQGKTLIERHPFFGKLKLWEWDRLSWKHLDHHLRQFSA